MKTGLIAFGLALLVVLVIESTISCVVLLSLAKKNNQPSPVVAQPVPQPRQSRMAGPPQANEPVRVRVVDPHDLTQLNPDFRR